MTALVQMRSSQFCPSSAGWFGGSRRAAAGKCTFLTTPCTFPIPLGVLHKDNKWTLMTSMELLGSVSSKSVVSTTNSNQPASSSASVSWRLTDLQLGVILEVRAPSFVRDHAPTGCEGVHHPWAIPIVPLQGRFFWQCTVADVEEGV